MILKNPRGSFAFFKSVRWNIINLNSACGYVPKRIFRAPNPVLMKQLLLTLLLVSFASLSALADSPEAILKDYRKQATQALERVNQSLEKAATPMITKLVKDGDTAGAQLLTEQYKAKLAGEPVAAPQASAVQLFALYDEARAKALSPVQKSSIARIDGLLKTAGGAKLETVTELGKVRAEIEAGKVTEKNTLPFPNAWSYHAAIDGPSVAEMNIMPDGTWNLKILASGKTEEGTWKKGSQPNIINLTYGGSSWDMIITKKTATMHRPDSGPRFLKAKL